MKKAESDSLIGTVLCERFELVKPLGHRLYRAIQRPLGREVAVEVLDSRRADAAAPKRFFLEVSRAAKLKHPNTRAIYDCGQTEDGLCFVAMELIEGETLQQVLAEHGRVPWHQALSMGAQVARALREAHGLGLVHGALRPANIIVGVDGLSGGQVKVLDFDRAKEGVGLTRASSDSSRFALGSAEAPVDALLYMAPELTRGELEARSDIYALGAVLFRAISGRTPFLDQTPDNDFGKRLRKTGPNLKMLADVPDGVAALVARCLERTPADRFRDTDELLEAIGRFADASGVVRRMIDSLPKPAEARPPLRLTASMLDQTPPPAPPEAQSIVVREGLAARRSSWCSARRAGVFTEPAALVVAHRESKVESSAGPCRPRLSRRALLRAAVALGVAGSALGAALVASGGVERSAGEGAPSAPGAMLEITSDPSGATVWRGLDRIGVTPMKLAVPRDGASAPRVVLSLFLDGYEPAVLMAEGRDGIVPVHQVLVRRTESPPMKGGAATSLPDAAVARPTGTPAKAAPGEGGALDEESKAGIGVSVDSRRAVSDQAGPPPPRPVLAKEGRFEG